MEKSFPEGVGGPVEENLRRIEEDIAGACHKAGRAREEVALLAVTKTVAPELINEAIRLGVTRIGENRVQEYLGKKEVLRLTGVETHLIGHLQTNKVSKIVGQVDMIQSVDSLHLARAVDQASLRLHRVTDVLVEVNIGGEEAKSGVAAGQAAELVAALGEMKGLRVRGLMTIPPISDTEKQKRDYFCRMQKLFIDIRDKKIDNVCMDILSMGMSSDYREAIMEGSTMVRIGTALFGKRAPAVR